MGIANNVAKTLGVETRRLQDLINGWKTARCVNFDAGLASGPWGTFCFIEGFGIGLFAEAMLALHGRKNSALADSGKRQDLIKSVSKILRNKLERYHPKKITVRLDGKDFSGDYILLEALNTRYIGPNLELVPRANINDGYFDVVCVAKNDCVKLHRYLNERNKGIASHLNLKIRRGRHLQIEWESSPVHIDDTPWPDDNDQNPLRWHAIDIKIQPGALVFLVPKTTS
jgi:diacylglycerol kinase family enzyme